jgi:heme-degrading monooxygenase HmoA
MPDATANASRQPAGQSMRGAANVFGYLRGTSESRAVRRLSGSSQASEANPRKVDGFVDNERFESKRRPGWFLSLSTWRDEKSMVRWRTMGVHHIVQKQGRSEVLQDYHLRIGDVTADTDAPKEAPVYEQRFDETEIGAAKLATLTEITPQLDAAFRSHIDVISALSLDISRDGVVDYDVFASIYNPGKFALLVLWRDARSADQWTPLRTIEIEILLHRKIRIVRDYGMFDRRETPQFFSDVKGHETKHSEPAH